MSKSLMYYVEKSESCPITTWFTNITFSAYTADCQNNNAGQMEQKLYLPEYLQNFSVWYTVYIFFLSLW